MRRECLPKALTRTLMARSHDLHRRRGMPRLGSCNPPLLDVEVSISNGWMIAALVLGQIYITFMMNGSRTASRLATRPICTARRARLIRVITPFEPRHLSTSTATRAEQRTKPSTDDLLERLISGSDMDPKKPPPTRRSAAASRPQGQAAEQRGIEMGGLFNDLKESQSEQPTESSLVTSQERFAQESHHFHVYTTKHNTHITLTKPNRDPLISLSAGNLGFRKASRGTYDAAHQLGSYVMGRIREQGLEPEIKSVEVILRGFGIGREAVSKILTGIEGTAIRQKICRVSDATRLKFGGTRSRKPRRLG